MKALKRPVFPFTAIVGQDEARLALILLMIDPRIGGLCMTGPRGSAKSTLARSLADLLPDASQHFVNLPLGATEEMVIGTLDLQQVLDDKQVRLQQGLLGQAHEGVLYVDEVNLLADNLVDILLDVTASGINSVERDGVSLQHEASFVFVGTMNPDEGELRPQLLDRFAFSTQLQNVTDISERIEVVRRREQFDGNPAAFCKEYAERQAALAERIACAREALDKVVCQPDRRESIARRCLQAGVDGLRADIVWIRAAKTHAAWCGRSEVVDEDIDAVAELVLSHRRQILPEPDNQAPSPPSRQKRDANGLAAGSSPEHAGGDWGSMPPQQQATGPQRYVGMVTDDSNSRQDKIRKFGLSQGRHKNGILQTGKRPDWFQTLLASQGEWPPQKWCPKKYRSKPAVVHMICLDTSASTLGQQLFAQAKGVVAGIVEQAYLARQQILLLGFGNQKVTEHLRQGRAPKNIHSLLEKITAGGGTPLRDVLLYARSHCKKLLRADRSIDFIHYLITDGRSCHDVRDIVLPGQRLLIDTEASVIKRGRGPELAETLNARYIPLTSLPEMRS